MSTEIEKHYVPTFKNNLELLAQQRLSKLEGLVTVVPCEGLAVAVRDQYGLVTARRKTERHEDTKYSDTPRGRRWLTPIEFYTAELYDESDLQRMLTDPQSPVLGRPGAHERIAAGSSGQSVALDLQGELGLRRGRLLKVRAEPRGAPAGLQRVRCPRPPHRPLLRDRRA